MASVVSGVILPRIDWGGGGGVEGAIKSSRDQLTPRSALPPGMVTGFGWLLDLLNDEMDVQTAILIRDFKKWAYEGKDANEAKWESGEWNWGKFGLNLSGWIQSFMGTTTEMPSFSPRTGVGYGLGASALFPDATIFSALVTGASEAWDNLVENATTKWGALRDTIGTIAGEISSSVSIAWGQLTDAAGVVWATVSGIIGEKLGEISEKSGAAWTTISATATTIVTGLSSWLGTTWTQITTTITTLWETMKTSVSTATNSLATSLATKWSQMYTNASAMWGAIKTTVSRIAEEIKTAVGEKFETLKGNLSTIISGIAGFFTNLGQAATTLKDNVAQAAREISTALSSSWSSLITRAIDSISEAIRGLEGFVSALATAIKNLPGIPSAPAARPPTSSAPPPSSGPSPKVGAVASSGAMSDIPLVVPASASVVAAGLPALAAAAVNVGPNYIDNGMDMAQFEARVRVAVARGRV